MRPASFFAAPDLRAAPYPNGGFCEKLLTQDESNVSLSARAPCSRHLLLKSRSQQRVVIDVIGIRRRFRARLGD
jgi:hypothetical protein